MYGEKAEGNLRSFFINHRRFRNVHPVKREGEASVSEVDMLVFLQLPAPVLHLPCFDEAGVLVGEIKSFLLWMLPGAIMNVLPKEWILYDV
ncbi:hypothetical protein HMPREF0083_03511 [Aneurinibacillus aneurinilyticus ATCC 12856]|uniref:Uncharacterized protein n=1 Tax=Aneurinibacillus aneurinilyticus ATCC 12856 TaxID=649747 RepID=U1YC80_ANEAE|nr:hypothetical protein HMPREF0083_03511 [Aneurinibacillus aneurinilyticus ATCC 12856]